MHERNKKRLKASGIVLVLLPVVLGLIRWLTDSDKIVFLVIWVICMFAISAYLVSIEYYDNTIHRIASGEQGAEEDAAQDPEEGGDE